MPRDGSAVYHIPPGTDAYPDTTIESTKYNVMVHDVEQDLNEPRPIIAGGTGANNARDALINLGGEMSGQLVDNYDMFPFLSGSFISAPGATGAPTPTEAFEGIAYVYDANNMVLEARALVTTDVPGKKYVRHKSATLWKPWFAQIGSVSEADDLYVNVIGDKMTGDLMMTRASAPTTGYIFYGEGGTVYVGYDGTQMISSAPFALPGDPPPLAQHAVRRDFMEAADAALKAALLIEINKKADLTAVPTIASSAEFAANTAPASKYLSSTTVWGVGLVGVAYGAQINLSTGFDFQWPGGPMHNPAGAKQGQKGTVLIQGGITGWGTSWKFPNSARPVWSGGNDILTYSVLSSDYIWCVYLPAMG
jgi:hypothetical protein